MKTNSVAEPGPDTALGRGIHAILSERIGGGVDPAARTIEDLYGWAAGLDESRRAAAELRRVAELDDEVIELRCRVHELEQELADLRGSRETVDARVEQAVLAERRQHVAGYRLPSILTFAG